MPMRVLIRLLGVLLIPVGDAGAAWTITESQTEPSSAAGIGHQRLVANDRANGMDATLDFARVSPKSGKLRVIDNPGGSQDLADAMRANNGVAGVNGGYFDENFSPLGLRVIDGKMSSPLSKGRLLSGVMTGSDALVRILRRSEFSPSTKSAVAIQCGPFLVDHGRPVPGLESQRPARRTFAAVTNTNEVMLGVTSDLSLQQLSSVLAGLTDLNIQRALNLDGGSSTAFWFKRKDGSILSIREQKNVRDFVCVEAR